MCLCVSLFFKSQPEHLVLKCTSHLLTDVPCEAYLAFGCVLRLD